MKTSKVLIFYCCIGVPLVLLTYLVLSMCTGHVGTQSSEVQGVPGTKSVHMDALYDSSKEQAVVNSRPSTAQGEGKVHSISIWTEVNAEVDRSLISKASGQPDLGGKETFGKHPGSYRLPLDLMKCDNCFRWRHPLRLRPRGDLCRSDSGGDWEDVDLLILCNTKHFNTEHRAVLRDIYNPHNILHHKVRLVFLFGLDPGGDRRREEALQQESVQHGDILQTVVNGTYHNLTLLVTNGYQWAMEQCPRARFTAKVSDDHLMNLVGVLDVLDTYGHTQLHDVVFGYCYMRLFPFRTPRTHKMYMNYNMYPFALLPRFCAGACLLVSMVTVREMMAEAGNMAYPTMMDDANIGMMIQFTGHQTCHVPNVEMSRQPLVKLFSRNSTLRISPSEICAAVQSKVPTMGMHLHGLRPAIMKTIWKNCPNFKQHISKGALRISCPRRKPPFVKGAFKGNQWIQNQDV